VVVASVGRPRYRRKTIVIIDLLSIIHHLLLSEFICEIVAAIFKSRPGSHRGIDLDGQPCISWNRPHLQLAKMPLWPRNPDPVEFLYPVKRGGSRQTTLTESSVRPLW
jgi:hypothetical protein